MFYNIFLLSTGDKLFCRKKYNSIISLFSTFLYLQCLCISLGVLDIGTVKCSLVWRFINCKLSDNKDIELVRSIKFYEFCVLRRGIKEKLLLTIILKVWKACGSFWYLKSSTKYGKSCIVNFCYCSFTDVFKELRAHFLPSSYFSANFLVRVG